MTSLSTKLTRTFSYQTSRNKQAVCTSKPLTCDPDSDPLYSVHCNVLIDDNMFTPDEYVLLVKPPASMD